MIPLLSRAAVRELDAHAVDAIGVPGIVLMENAGRGAFEAIARRFSSALSRVVIVAGPGQNGGDAWVVWRHLVLSGQRPRGFLIGARERIRGDALTNLAALERLGEAVEVLADEDLQPLERELASASLIVDGLFGTGLDRAIEGRHARVVELIDRASAPVVALDLPSGVDADRGTVLGVAPRAALTVTFAAHKPGLHQHPGAELCGELCCVSIGVPLDQARAQGAVIEASDVARWVQARPTAAHKGSAGHVLVVAGAPGRTGAAVLSGLGSLRMGAGLTTLCSWASARATLDAKVLELMTAELPQGGKAAAQAALEIAKDKQAVVVGPGLGLDDDARLLCQELARSLLVPAVLDADALTALGAEHALLRSASGPRVLTPHPGEAARLLGGSAATIQADRYAAARALADASGAVVVLKGARTVIAEPGGRVRVCPTGTPAMAVAGTGDVLAGAIAALCCTLPPFDAASAAVYLHGLAGELAAPGDRGLLASELAAALPRALEHCRTEPAHLARSLSQ